jgi:hypothetical protein
MHQCFLCVVELHVTNIKIFGVAQQCICVLIYACRNNKMYVGLHAKCLILLSYLAKFGVSRQIFVEVPNINFTEIHPMGDPLMEMDGRADISLSPCFSRTDTAHFLTGQNYALSLGSDIMSQ